MSHTYRQANVVAHATILAKLPAPAFKVRDWASKGSPKTQDAVEALARVNGWITERIFDAAHGRRYLIFVYPSGDAKMRRACFDLLTGA